MLSLDRDILRIIAGYEPSSPIGKMSAHDIVNLCSTCKEMLRLFGDEFWTKAIIPPYNQCTFQNPYTVFKLTSRCHIGGVLVASYMLNYTDITRCIAQLLMKYDNMFYALNSITAHNCVEILDMIAHLTWKPYLATFKIAVIYKSYEVFEALLHVHFENPAFDNIHKVVIDSGDLKCVDILLKVKPELYATMVLYAIKINKYSMYAHLKNNFKMDTALRMLADRGIIMNPGELNYNVQRGVAYC